MLEPENFFNLREFKHKELFDDVQFVWEALKRLKPYIKDIIIPNVAKLRRDGDVLSKTVVFFNGEVIDDGIEIEPGDAIKGTLKIHRKGNELKGASVLYAGVVLFDDNISLGEGTVVEPGALIKGPTMIGNNSEVRQGAYIRGNCLVGDRCVVGHTTEIKGGVMLDGAKAGHFAYIGDSILGNNVNLGAGTKLANLKIFGSEITFKIEGQIYKTGLRKLGAIIGDSSELGCNSVCNPGTLLGKASLVYTNITVPGGFFPNNSLIRIKTKNAVTVGRHKLKIGPENENV
jgi:NDP-sugar pyrophosphorylase family protein